MTIVDLDNWALFASTKVGQTMLLYTNILYSVIFSVDDIACEAANTFSSAGSQIVMPLTLFT